MHVQVECPTRSDICHDGAGEAHLASPLQPNLAHVPNRPGCAIVEDCAARDSLLPVDVAALPYLTLTS